ncbi:MAG: amidohydrolase [Treponema sp.]|jgi:predicted amidohydrolase YtcJ|nr:amidohydrolase [Treponema sp.]
MKARRVQIVYNAKAYIARGEFREALRIEDGRIIRTGSGRELLDAAPAGAEKLDAQGCLVLPAFHDSHLHLRWLGQRAGMIECAGASSVEEIIRRGRDLVARLKPPAGTWIQGAGVNPDLFTGEKRDPSRDDLDRVSGEHPLILSRHCGHTIYCNSPALKTAGISESAPEMEGGTIEKDELGRPTGVLRENANALIRDRIPPPGKAEALSCVRLAAEKALSLGITAAGSYDTLSPDPDETAGVYRALCGGGRRIRVTMQCGISGREDILDACLGRGLVTGKILYEEPAAGPLLKMGPIKLFIDGTLGSHTAWMRRPYRDRGETSGFPVLDLESLEGFIRKADAGKLQTLVHAIGDAGMDAVITAFEKIAGGLPGPERNPLRHGIIHCQITDPELLERMARGRILALVQPVFLAEDMYILEKRVGPELAATSYAWGAMNRLGVAVSYGTDAPVSDLNPLLNISWAVLRQNPADGFPEGGFYPAERVDLADAIDAYTAGSAWPGFDEQRLGRIRPGFLADLVFIDRDLFSIPARDIHRARVIRTMLAGETVWEGPGSG